MKAPNEYVLNRDEVEFKSRNGRFSEIIDNFGIETLYYLLYKAENDDDYELCSLIVKRLNIYNINRGTNYPLNYRTYA